MAQTLTKRLLVIGISGAVDDLGNDRITLEQLDNALFFLDQGSVVDRQVQSGLGESNRIIEMVDERFFRDSTTANAAQARVKAALERAENENRVRWAVVAAAKQRKITPIRYLELFLKEHGVLGSEVHLEYEGTDDQKYQYAFIEQAIVKSGAPLTVIWLKPRELENS